MQNPPKINLPNVPWDGTLDLLHCTYKSLLCQGAGLFVIFCFLKDLKEVIEQDFAFVCKGGYIVVLAQVLNAGNFGVSQGMERLIKN